MKKKAISADDTNASQKPISVRLKPEDADAFIELVKSTGGKVSPTAAEILTDWMLRKKAETKRANSTDDNESPLTEHLASAVIDILFRDKKWAVRAVEDSGLAAIEAESTYFKRIQHFFSEKKVISSSWTPWIVSRILHHLKLNKNVFLVAESGTTIKSLMDDLGGCLREHADTIISQYNEGFSIQIISNNYPGSESYEEFGRRPESQLKSHFTLRSSDTMSVSTVPTESNRISDLVQCHLVPGRPFRDYSAVLGSESEAYLKAAYANKKDGDVFIGLVTGNWVRLDDSRPAWAYPLARGEGHQSFKENVLRICEECYLVTPLCKIFANSLDQFNADLFATEKDGEVYKQVDVGDRLKENKLKVVSTSRELGTSVVGFHSERVRSKLAAPNTKPKDFADFVNLDITQIPHMFIPFSQSFGISRDEEIKRELPHKSTRRPDFRTQYFNIP